MANDKDPIAFERQVTGYREIDADEWREMQDECALQDHFFKASPIELVGMWDSGLNLAGSPLSPFEQHALMIAWLNTFDRVPPTVVGPNAVGSTGSMPSAAMVPKPNPADDQMLNMHDVMLLVGMSESSLKRKWADGTFPRPIRLSIRRNGWRAKDIKDWISEREASSRKGRY